VLALAGITVLADLGYQGLGSLVSGGGCQMDCVSGQVTT
jgi:hypothetical protein